MVLVIYFLVFIKQLKLMTYVYNMLLPVISYWSEVVSSHIRLAEPVLIIIITCQGNGQAHQQWQFGLAILALSLITFLVPL